MVSYGGKHIIYPRMTAASILLRPTDVTWPGNISVSVSALGIEAETIPGMLEWWNEHIQPDAPPVPLVSIEYTERIHMEIAIDGAYQTFDFQLTPNGGNAGLNLSRGHGIVTVTARMFIWGIGGFPNPSNSFFPKWQFWSAAPPADIPVIAEVNGQVVDNFGPDSTSTGTDENILTIQREFSERVPIDFFPTTSNVTYPWVNVASFDVDTDNPPTPPP